LPEKLTMYSEAEGSWRCSRTAKNIVVSWTCCTNTLPTCLLNSHTDHLPFYVYDARVPSDEDI
jgi:hypothetical protein